MWLCSFDVGKTWFKINEAKMKTFVGKSCNVKLPNGIELKELSIDEAIVFACYHNDIVIISKYGQYKYIPDQDAPISGW